MKLKTKLLLGIFLLLVITTGTIIFYATTTILNDRKSYLFDQTSSQAQSFKEGIHQETEYITNSLNFVKDEETYEKLSLLQKNKNYIATIKTDRINKSPTILFKNDSSAFYNETILDDFILFLTKEQNPVVNTVLFSKIDKNVLLYQTFINKEKQIYISHVYSLAKQISQFEADKQSTNFIYFDGEILTKDFSDDLIKTEIDEIKNSPITQKTFIGNVLINGKEVKSLISLHKIKSPDLILGMVVPTKKAFQSSRNLAINTLVFSSVLISISLIIGIIFSSKITNPINELIIAATNTAKGIYNYKENIPTKDELKLLGKSFESMNQKLSKHIADKEDMIQQLDNANKKLVDFNRDLEKIVKERTAELNKSNKFIKAMIDSLDQGLIVFDNKLQIAPTYTKAVETIFDTQIEEQTRFTDVIKKTEENEVTKISKWVEILFNNLIPLESVLPLGPQQVISGNGFEDANYKHVNLKYYPMFNEEQKITNVVAVATDVTKEKINEHNFEVKEKYVQKILKILNSKNSFQSFLNEKNSILKKLKDCYNPQENTFNFKLAIMMFHSLTGGFGMYSMKELQTLSRYNEEQILQMEQAFEFGELNIDQFMENLQHFEDEINKEISSIDKSLGTNFSTGSKLVELKQTDIQLFLKKLQNLDQTAVIKAIKAEFEKVFIFKTFEQLTKDYEDLCIQLADRLGKKILPFQYVNKHEKLDAEYYESFFNSLVHLFRNNMDHGIETPNKRIALGKAPEGTIRLSIENNDTFYKIVISDNGAGINPAKIRERLATLSPDEDFSNEDDQQIINHIFDANFSTKDQANDISGRGVGMSAIKEVLDRIGGKIILNSNVGKGTQFLFILPKPQKNA